MKLFSQKTQFLDLKSVSGSTLNYNGSIFTLNKKQYIIYRTQQCLTESSQLAVSELDKDKPISFKHLIVPNIRNLEDPRVVLKDQKIYVFYNSGVGNLYNSWFQSDLQINVAIFDEEFNFISNHFCYWQNSNEVEKNWSFINYDNQWYCIYSFKPYILLKFNEKWQAEEVYREDLKIKWNYGEIRGGTSPITLMPPLNLGSRGSLNPQRIIIAHSRYDYPVRKYNKTPEYLGFCILLNYDYPFKPFSISKHPLLNPEGKSAMRSSSVVFPSGAIVDKDKILISSGSGDIECRIDSFDIEDIRANLLLL